MPVCLYQGSIVMIIEMIEERSIITPIGITNWHNTNQRFGIKDADRLRHIYVIGKTGTGKSTMLQNMAISDIQKGKGVCVIDPHGDIVESLLDYVPKERIQDVIYFNAADTTALIPFNPLYNIAPAHRHIIAASLVSTFKKIWSDSWGPRLEYILNLSILTLLCYPTATLLDIQPLLTIKDFRDEVLEHVTDIHVRSFWLNEYDKYPATLRMDAISPVLNKMGLFAINPILRSIVTQQGSINMQEIVNGGKILLCNFSKGSIGEEVSSILGSMVLTALQHAALQRSTKPEETRKPFYTYVDEMHSFVTLAFTFLAEARKYGLSFFLAHQYLEQLDKRIHAAIFGNVGTIISFQVGNTDAEVLAKEFFPVFDAADFVNLPKFSMYLKLMIDGTASKPFSAMSDSLSKSNFSNKEAIIDLNMARNKSVAISIQRESKKVQSKLF